MNPRSTLMCGLHTSDALCPRSMLLRGLHAGVPLRLNGCFATPMPLFCSPGGHGNISDTAGSHNGGDARDLGEQHKELVKEMGFDG
ncbi:uncharacterized protein LOC121053302 isoform X2 [Oryza brachyantha]|uniref:uncharacterized protein LOC121053302 isoform X2 n=1 Tax=Oryza brachyantha TaxID=4533 RepID=UPI001ADB8ED3|nr:uncharacterized protein LOC121053302 isoform X2 [Oryza brachyantha]